MKQKMLFCASIVLPALALVLSLASPAWADEPAPVECTTSPVTCEYASQCYSMYACLKTGCDPQKQVCQSTGTWSPCGSCGSQNDN
jgi:hypothetical protein